MSRQVVGVQREVSGCWPRSHVSAASPGAAAHILGGAPSPPLGDVALVLALVGVVLAPLAIVAFVLSVRERRRMLDAGLHDDRVAAAMWISGAATALLALGVVLLLVIPTIAIAAGHG